MAAALHLLAVEPHVACVVRVQPLYADILVDLNQNADRPAVGRYLGTASLRNYSVAYNLMFAPIARISQPIGQAMFAALSRVQDDLKRLGDAG